MLELAEQLCQRFEGFKDAPYLCPAGVATIGFGSTHYEDGRKVLMSDSPITRDRALELLRHELLRTYLPGVRRLCPGLYADALASGDSRALCAVVDFAYNLGVGRLQTSTLRRKLNAGDWAGAREELMKWTLGGGRVLRGLVLRRRAECELLPKVA